VSLGLGVVLVEWDSGCFDISIDGYRFLGLVWGLGVVALWFVVLMGWCLVWWDLWVGV